MAGILSNITVIDWTQNVAGPYCTQILGDLGATVIKIERPVTGDDTRQWAPPAWDGEATTFLGLNRNKRSICIDANHDKGQEIIKGLVKNADVFIHSMKPGSAEARGLGYEELSVQNPRLIYCAISGFGEEGPLKSMPGYDPLIQAYSGIMSITGNPGDDPARVGVSMIDMTTGLWSLIGIQLALMERDQTGKGSRVRASLFETGVGWMNLPLMNYMATGNIPEKHGTGTAMVAPYEAFRTKDDWVIIAAGNNRLFEKLCTALGLSELLDDVRFITNKDRVMNREILHSLIEKRTLDFHTEAIIELLSKEVPCSLINTVDKVYEEEQVESLGLIKEVKDIRINNFKMIDLPFRIDNKRSSYRLPPPILGEHTAEILYEMGYSSEEIETLASEQIVEKLK